MSGESESKAGTFGDRLVGKAKEVAGSLVGSQELKEEGQLHQRKAEAEAEAARAGVSAQLREAEAELSIEQSELDADGLRIDAEVAREEDERRIEHDRQVEMSRLDGEARQMDDANHRRETAEEVMTDRMEAAAFRERQAANAKAALLESEADQARQSADMLDAAINVPTPEETQ